MSIGRIHVTVGPEVVGETLERLRQIEESLSFLQHLKPKEKARLVKPRPATQEVLQGIAELQRDAGIPPAEGDPMLADLSVYSALTHIGDRVAVLARRIQDTRFLAGSEAWNQGLIRYGMLRQLQRDNPALKDRLDRLQRLIASQTGRTTPVDDAPEAPEPDDPAE